MTPEEQVEYLGLAATVGRLMASLKQTEAALAGANERLSQAESTEDE